VIDEDLLEVVNFKDTKFTSGVVLWSFESKYWDVFESEEDIFQYIDIYSIQLSLSDY
jgi:hypothetical protein